MQINKKILIPIAIVITLAVIGTVIYFIFIKPSKSYPKEPINQTSLGTTKEEVEITKVTAPGGNYPIYSVSNSVQLEKIKQMMSSLNLNLTLKSSKEGEYYNWADDNNSFSYDLEQNVLLFKLANGIQSDEAEITGYSFANFINKYFGFNWTYNVFTNEKRTTGETVYYAKRYMTGKITLETRENNNATDYLAYKDGKLIYGKIILTEFADSGVLAPLISSSKLKEYVNLNNYPKEIYPQYSGIQDTILSQVDYLSSEFEKISNTLNNCTGTAAELVYLYKTLNQKLLTPVYKLDLQCEITYNTKAYKIPATGFINAIDPNYVNVPE